ncbi:hypothetical protein CXB51_025494 [Gossypium anomalum]|uniref:Bet v I/Major latex protein domain-containing protein n=1 Tax=Gossypium anomalum TaxID=47600 RepID=A0A8J6CQF9_9ROSI|nr:hypothetical protein CXB51_025494 [Gossypium anomalum]
MNLPLHSPVAPVRLFKAFTIEAAKVWPTAAPNAVKSVEVEANPSSGSIVKINFVEGGPLGDSLEKSVMRTSLVALEIDLIYYP